MLAVHRTTHREMAKKIIVIHVIPTFIGKGIPLIAPRHRTIPLTLLSCRRHSDGVVRLHYAIEPTAAGARSGKNRFHNRSVVAQVRRPPRFTCATTQQAAAR